MATASGGNAGWETAEDGRATSLLVHTRQRSYVLPWHLFLFAEGTEAEVRAVFHTHVLAVQGAGLTALLADLADQTVITLWEPDRTAKFSPAPSSQITSLSVTQNK